MGKNIPFSIFFYWFIFVSSKAQLKCIRFTAQASRILMFVVLEIKTGGGCFPRSRSPRKDGTTGTRRRRHWCWRQRPWKERVIKTEVKQEWTDSTGHSLHGERSGDMGFLLRPGLETLTNQHSFYYIRQQKNLPAYCIKQGFGQTAGSHAANAVTTLIPQGNTRGEERW